MPARICDQCESALTPADALTVLQCLDDDPGPLGRKEHRMHLRRPATALAAATICTALSLTACGGGSDDSAAAQRPDRR